ncbi:MAG: hypothetical protein AAB588_05175 [Patescibacteria group bacterium]
MEKSFARFIEAIHHYPDYFQESQLQSFLKGSEIKLLKDLGFLKRGDDLKEIPCPSCDDTHFLDVLIENGKLYCVCSTSDTSRNYLNPQAVETWHFDVETFLQKMALQLGIDDRVEKLVVPNMWQIGGITQDGMRHSCYYYQGKKISEALAFVQKQPSQMRRYILFTNHEAVFSIPSDHELVNIPVNEITGLEKEQLIFDGRHFGEYLVSGFRSVVFHKNGDLIANGETIASITPSTAEYHFVELLWGNFNEPVSHQRTQRHIYQKTGKEYEDDASKLSHKQKNKVKKESKKPALIDEIFKRTKDLEGKNAYIMKNPA